MSLPSPLAYNFKCFPLSLVERPKPLNYLKWFCTIPSVPSSLIILCASPSHRAFFQVFILAIHPTTGSLHMLLLLPGMRLPLYPLKHFFSVLSDLPNLARALSVYPPSPTFTTDIILNSTIRWFSSVSQSCLTLCDPMNRSTPGLPVHHQLLEFTHTHVHQVGDAIQLSNPLSFPSPPAPNPTQHQSLFQ